MTDRPSFNYDPSFELRGSIAHERLYRFEERFSGAYQEAWRAWLNGRRDEAEERFEAARGFASIIHPERLVDLIRMERSQIEDSIGITLPGELR